MDGKITCAEYAMENVYPIRMKLTIISSQTDTIENYTDLREIAFTVLDSQIRKKF